jgi:Tol biopolymer transport system component
VDSILVLSEAGGAPELLGVHTLDPDVLHSLTWSPEGRWIAYVNGNERSRLLATIENSSIWLLDANGGEPVPVVQGEHLNVSPQWLDNRHLLFVSNRDGTRGVYAVEVGNDGARATPRRVPGPAAPHSISVSANGRKLAYSSIEWRNSIRSIPIQVSEAVSIRAAAPITRQNRVIFDFGLSPDGQRIAFDTDLGGKGAIFRQRVVGGQPELVATLSEGASGPDWSPEGTEIAFSTKRFIGPGPGKIFVVPAAGGEPVRVADFPGYDSSPDWAPDGLAIAFVSRPPSEGATPNIWIVSRDNPDRVWGEPVQLTDFGCDAPDWASDGSGLLCHESSGLTWGSAIAFVSPGGEVLWRYDPTADGLQYPTLPRFSADDSRIYFWAESDASWGVWWIQDGGGRAAKAVAFDDLSLFGGGLSVGPDAIYMGVGEVEGDIWVMDLEW